MSGRLTEGFREIIDLRWDEFVLMEQNLSGTNFDSIVTSLVRGCRKGNLRAIQTALDRLDGKIAQELEIEYPKFYTLYPRATKTADDASIIDGDSPFGVDKKTLAVPVQQEITNLVGAAADMDELVAQEEELPTGSLRAVLEKMLDSPKQIVSDILNAADAIDKASLERGNPMVKSVIVAGLMKLVHDGRINAVFEVFDQIDGKVADKYKVLGKDVFIKRYDLIAPAGAVKNDDGIYQVEVNDIAGAWAVRLEQLKKKGR